MEAFPVWNNVPARFSFKDRDGDPQIHLFFDLAPFVSIKDNEVNFVSLTPQWSKFVYELDLQSGRRYRTLKYCNQEDVWKNYNGELKTPPYTTGFVPRMLDQIGKPLEVKVFGRDRYYNHEGKWLPVSHRVRVVGGVIMHYCKSHPCQGKKGWLARLVLIAVDPMDSSFQNVRDLDDLKNHIDWNRFKSFIQNEKGRFTLKNRDIPAYRWIATVQPKKALKFALRTGKYFRFDDMKIMRDSCHKLYDYLWDTAEMTRKNEIDPEGVTKFDNYVEDLKSRNVIDESVDVDNKAEKMSVDMISYFKDWHLNLFGRYSVCSRYVRPGSINYDIRRHWFFTYLTMFARTQELGFVFSCTKGGWLKNPIMADNTFAFDPKLEMWPCPKTFIDRAFSSTVPVLVDQRNQGAEHYAYIDYDNQEGGTHEKLHSLVPLSGKRIRCANRNEDKKDILVYRDKNIFPDDEVWENFVIRKDYKDQIIR